MNCEREREREERMVSFSGPSVDICNFSSMHLSVSWRDGHRAVRSLYSVYTMRTRQIKYHHSIPFGSIAISRNSPIAPPPLPPLRPCSFSRRIAMADGYHQPNEYTRRVIFATTIQRREKYSSRGLWEAISNKNLEDRSSFPREKWLERLAVCQFVYRRYRRDVLLLYICVFA